MAGMTMLAPLESSSHNGSRPPLKFSINDLEQRFVFI